MTDAPCIRCGNTPRYPSRRICRQCVNAEEAARARAKRSARGESGECCPLDGQPYRDHQRCRACGICVGPVHIETTVDVTGRCEDCAAWAKKQQKRAA